MWKCRKWDYWSLRSRVRAGSDPTAAQLTVWRTGDGWEVRWNLSLCCQVGCKDVWTAVQPVDISLISNKSALKPWELFQSLSKTLDFDDWKIQVFTWQKMQAPFLRPSMVEALMMSSISGTSGSAMAAAAAVLWSEMTPHCRECATRGE